jgi:two-component system, chemotaxis family, sensor kinase Cph1
MTQSAHPAFGTADLTNCERELIHLAGSVMPHGALLVLDEPSLRVLQVSANTTELLDVAPEALLGRTLADWNPPLAATVRRLLEQDRLEVQVPLHARVPPDGAGMEGLLHRTPTQGLILELEPPAPEPIASSEPLPTRVRSVIAQITATTSISALCDTMARAMRELIGYDRVMVYRFDPDGHGEIAAEAREEALEPYLGLHYPASDIPQRARELYLRNRVRVLGDVGYTAVPILPRLSPLTGTELDMSLCSLRSMSPLHLQYLQNMGVTATLVTSLVKGGALWGLIACHHYSPRRLPYDLRTACELLSEVFSTRLAALDAEANAQSELLVRRLEQQLVDEVSTSGEWLDGLFAVLRALVGPLEATGAAVLYEGQTLTSGAVPSSDELSRLVGWIAEHGVGQLFETSAVARIDPAFARATGIASGVLAIRLTVTRLDYLVWFRKEQVQTVRWAGDPRKAYLGDDPNHLSPRRSFAEWIEQVRGTAKAWGAREVAIARMLQSSLSDIIQQVQAVRVLIAARQLATVSRVVERAGGAMVVLDDRDHVLLVNQAFRRLIGSDAPPPDSVTALAGQFTDPERLLELMRKVRWEQRPWMGEMTILARGQPVPMGVRLDTAPAPEGGLLGTVMMLTDLRERQEAETVRRSLSRALEGQEGKPRTEFDRMLEAVLANARLAMMSITGSEEETSQPVALRNIESLTRRAAELTRQMVMFAAMARE